MSNSNMKRHFLIAITAGLFLTSCINPRVIMSVDKVLPATSAEQVVVFEHVDSLPVKCDTVGHLRLKDSGFTLPSRGTYPYVVSYARKKAAECGANALNIDEHKLPKRGTTTHQVWATMLLLPDAQESTFTAWAQLESNLNRDAAMVGRVLEDLSHDFRPHHALKLSAGPAWIYSDIYTATGVRKNTFAMDLMAEYEYTWKSGLGVGATFSHAWGFVDGNPLKLIYVGPSFVYAFREARQWGAEVAIGIGYARYNDGYRSDNGFGMMYKVGAEYLFTRHLGVGAEINLLDTRFSEPEGVDLPKNEAFGFSRLNLLIGLRAYF